MPYYASLRKEDPEVRVRVAEGLRRLRKAIRAEVPARTLDGDLLIASWNIREFDSRKYGGRLVDSFYFIAEILSHFDLIAIQEVRGDLSALDRVQGLLGSWWKYLVTDVTEGASGNGERMAFLYDSRKVTFGGLAGEIVLPRSKVDPDILQFARTPFVCGFKAGWARIDLCTVHIYYGEGKSLDPRRLKEIGDLAGFLARRAKVDAPPAPAAGAAPAPRASQGADNLILLGDFNIFDPGDATLKAITDAGFVVPKVLTDRAGSNMARDKYYDQIAIWRGKRFDTTDRGGVLNYYEAVFRPEDEALYAADIKPAKSGKPPTYKDWKSYQMSDHLLLWAAFKVDFAEDYLTELATPEVP
ncbi:endonuclease/exonuclease/phosphatase family protein [Brevundimonas subvibrioides]|uniref:endonuclease/exonuclease/phosphatase family protein n=1 Tax=Brevundimonas subvibrioides TaxID=74313 RepID=UPI0022B3A22E|nr:endonuclease/exonuclease/phosphatase family protein [Brevundimonas subvibrioides]